MQEIILYKTKDNIITLEVTINSDTVWLTQGQMSELFNQTKQNISLHINNIFKEGELKIKSVVKDSLTTAKDGKKYKTRWYNLDVIISVGYRVKSHRGTQFRIWATKVLKDHLIKGYTINEKILKEKSKKLNELQNTIKILENTIENQNIELDEAKGLLNVITDFNYALTILDEYDHNSLAIKGITKKEINKITYEETKKIIESMKNKYSTGLFGKEKDDSFKGSLGNIYQTFDGKDLYPSIEEKAANLLYFIVKNHSFVDGNKRIAAAIFLYFLAKNKILYRHDKTKRIADNTIVALTLMIAESKPDEKNIIIKVIVNLINKNNL